MKIFKVSEIGCDQRKQREYVVYWIKNPDKGSSFAKNTRFLRWLPGFFLIFLLCRLKYNGLLFYEGDDLIGHLFYKECVNDWRLFSINVSEKFRGQHYAKKMLTEFLKLAYGEKHISGVKIGAGGNKAVLHLWNEAIDNKLGLPFCLKAGAGIGSVVFVR